MFKFSFNVDEEFKQDDGNNVPDDTKGEIPENTVECYDCKEVTPTVSSIENLDVCELNSTEILIGNVKLKYMNPTHVLQQIDVHSNIQEAERNHTDLIPGIYEGGAKLWECTEDLLIYLQTYFSSDKWINKNVLDLGCGCGLLGIFALKFGSIVHFQDYNEDVLEKVTIPNVLLNYESNDNLEEISKTAMFFSGDWSKYIEYTKSECLFDFILTSETIYNPNNHKKLLETFSKKLKPDGVVLIAAKTYYFGVGGGFRQFEDLVKADKRFDFKSVWTSKDGVNREIAELRRVKITAVN